jgi:hypothetical protein
MWVRCRSIYTWKTSRESSVVDVRLDKRTDRPVFDVWIVSIDRWVWTPLSIETFQLTVRPQFETGMLLDDFLSDSVGLGEVVHDVSPPLHLDVLFK